MAPSQIDPFRESRYVRKQRSYEDKNNMPRTRWSQDSFRRKLKVLSGLFSTTSVFLPLQTPTTIVDSLEEQGQWKAAFPDNEMDVDQPISDQQPEQQTKPTHEIPCTSTCLLVKEVLQFSDRLDHLSVHPLFDPGRFFAPISDRNSQRQLMPALLLASRIVESQAFYDFVDGFLYGRRTHDNAQTVVAMNVQTKQRVKVPNARPTRFFLRYNCREEKKMPEKEMKAVHRVLKQIAPKLTYFIEAYWETDENGEWRQTHGSCDPVFDAKFNKTTACRITIEPEKFHNLHRTTIFKDGCGGMEYLRACLGFATTLIHEIGHALSFFEDRRIGSRGEIVFEEDEYHKPDVPGEIGWAMERHVFGLPEAEKYFSDELVCAWFRDLLQNSPKRKRGADE